MSPPYRGLAVVLASLALGASTSAAVNFTSSQITTPSDPTFPWFVYSSAGTLHVEGDVDGGDSNADIVCFQGPTGRVLLKASVTVASGRFSDDVPLTPLYNSSLHPFCVLRAVPTGDATSQPPGSPSGFAGPRIGLGSIRESRLAVPGSPLQFYYIRQAQPRGALVWASVGFGGLYTGYLFDPITSEASTYVFGVNGWFHHRDGCSVTSATCTQATGSGIIVDGNHVYSAGSAAGLYGNASQESRELVPYPALTYQVTRDSLTGDLQITEHDELVKCDPGGTAFFPAYDDPAWNDACSKFVYAGVQIDRTMIQDRAGRRGRITDVWTSTTGTAHQVELRYEQEFQGDQMQFVRPTVRYPWLGASYATPTVGQTIPGPSASGPATVFVDSNADLVDHFRQPQAAVRFSTPPVDIHWWYAGDTYIQATFRITGTVPATGSLVIEHSYFMEPTKELLQDAVDPPTIAITVPADGSTVDHADVTVSGTASDPGGSVESVAVNGTTASLQLDGTWTAALTLAEGQNVITAVATDVTGNPATASATVTFDPEGSPGPAPGATTSTTVSVTSTTSTLPLSFSGTGSAASECYVTFEGIATGRLDCTDGDAACDADGAANGSCSFALRVCAAQALRGCQAATVTSLKAIPTKLAIPLPVVPAGTPVCGAPASVVVPLRRNGRRPGRVSVAVVAKSDHKPKRERDVLRFRCLPSA